MQKGKFWPHIRALIWEKAEELFMQEQMRTMDLNTRPEKSELREGGFFYTAKLIVLRELYLARKPSKSEKPCFSKKNTYQWFCNTAKRRHAELTRENGKSAKFTHFLINYSVNPKATF